MTKATPEELKIYADILCQLDPYIGTDDDEAVDLSGSMGILIREIGIRSMSSVTIKETP